MSVENKRDFDKSANPPRIIVEQQNANAYKKVYEQLVQTRAMMILGFAHLEQLEGCCTERHCE